MTDIPLNGKVDKGKKHWDWQWAVLNETVRGVLIEEMIFEENTRRRRGNYSKNSSAPGTKLSGKILAATSREQPEGHWIWSKSAKCRGAERQRGNCAGPRRALGKRGPTVGGREGLPWTWDRCFGTENRL